MKNPEGKVYPALGKDYPKLKKLAEKEGRSASSQAAWVLKKYVKGELVDK